MVLGVWNLCRIMASLRGGGFRRSLFLPLWSGLWRVFELVAQ